MIKVLYVLSTLKRSGPTSQLYNLLKHLDRSLYLPVVVTLSSEPKDSLWSKYEALNIELHSLNLSRFKAMFLATRNLSKFVKRIGPEIIHSQGLRGDFLSSHLSLPVPKICSVRNFPQIDYLMTYGRLSGYLMAKSHIKALNKINRPVGVSRSVCQNLVNVFGLMNVHSIHNGVDTDLYFPIKNEKKEKFRKKLNLPLGSRIWITSGHLSSRKSPIFLIQAWMQDQFKFKDDHLLFIGDGELFEKCRILAERNDNIHFMGRVNNVVEYLQASDFYLSASKGEGLPNAVLEAMACGLPFVLSSIPPHREIWEMGPNCGRIYEEGCFDELEFNMAEIVSMDYQNIKDEVLELVSKNFSAKIMSASYQNEYQRLLSEHAEN